MILQANIMICPSCGQGILYTMQRDGLEVSQCFMCGDEFEIRFGADGKEGTTEIRPLKPS
jgi:uncharacterized protein (DUF983 family)